MPYLPNGTFAESQDEYIARLERENAEARREIVDLQDSLHQALEEARILARFALRFSASKPA
jgi:hypothetical protein